MTKAELRKVKPGSLLKVRWIDSPDTIAMLLDKPDWNQKGDIDLHCFQVSNKGVGYTDHHIQHTQVVEVLSGKVLPHTKWIL